MRVFNTLMLHGQLEPKQIADFIKREHKEARELLYRMFKAGYLQMQVRQALTVLPFFAVPSLVLPESSTACSKQDADAGAPDVHRSVL